MKDIKLPLRIGYIDLLDGINVNGKVIPMFDLEAPYPENAPYIIIDGIIPIQNNTRDDFSGEVTVELLIYTVYKGDFGGREEADLIANAVLGLLIPTPGKSGVSASGFNVFRAKLLTSNDEMSYTDTRRTYRRRLTIEHFVQQL